MTLRKLIIKYFLLQLPGYVLLICVIILIQKVVNVSAYAMWSAFGLWIAKDIVLFPFLGRYYDASYHKDRFSMIGQQGVVCKPLSPKGMVRIKGELWRAKALDPESTINMGKVVVVEKLKGLTLQVKPNFKEQAIRI